MSIGERIMRLLPDPDYDRIRTELLLALADGRWQSTTELMRVLRNNPRGECRGGPGTMFTTLRKLTDEVIQSILVPKKFHLLWRLFQPFFI